MTLKHAHGHVSLIFHIITNPIVFLVAVVDCPSEDFLNSLCNDRAEDFRSFFSEGDVNGQPSVVVHFTPVSVMKDPRYVRHLWLLLASPCHRYTRRIKDVPQNRGMRGGNGGHCSKFLPIITQDMRLEFELWTNAFSAMTWP
jgi:hypothetical protein